MNTQKNEENKKLQIELKEASQTTTSISETARKMTENKEEVKKTLKKRKVSDFIKKKVKDSELDADNREVIKQRRTYMIDSISKDNNTVYNATVCKINNKIQLFTQDLADKEVLKFIESQEKMSIFRSSDIIKLLSTKGGAYGDKIRKALYKHAYRVHKATYEKDQEAMIQQAIQKKKTLIFYDINNDEIQRKNYVFVKI